MATAAANLIAFQTAMDQLEVKYEEQQNTKLPCVRIGYTLENINHLDVYFWFDEDGTTAHVSTGVIAHVPENKTDVMLRAINAANVNYRWLCFFIDKDNDIVANADLILSPNTVGDTCYEILQRTISICDEAYSGFMRAMWAE